MKLLIVGGGLLGQELMSSTPRAIVIEDSPKRLEMLRESYGEERVIEGPWKPEHFDIPDLDSVVIATGDDDRNIEIAVFAQTKEIPFIVIKVKDPDRIPKLKEMGFENVICPYQFAARAIRASIAPRAKDLIEIPIFPDSPLIGKKIEELQFGIDAIIVGVIRNGNVLRAEGLELERGDHLLIVSIGGRSKELQKTIVRKESKLKPFQAITALLFDAEDLNTTLSESLYLARVIGVPVNMIVSNDEILSKINEMVKVSGVEFSIHPRPDLSISNLKKILEEEGLEPGCIALRPLPSFKEKKGFRRWELFHFIDGMGASVLICKKRHPYYSLFNLLDEHPGSETVTDIAFKIAFLCRSQVKVLYYGEDPERQKKLVKSLESLYGVRSYEEKIDGNPAIEFVSEITSGERDLAVINWDSKSVNADLIGRAVMEGPSSLLLVRGGNVLMP
ncbi:MAG: trk/ktr system potassium uptake protein [Candidatus Methanomethylophilaceae archaeon]|nr:trk/ktr system potassium uptake protein [Candidatus Methanomethylophilaceae archaeon]